MDKITATSNEVKKGNCKMQQANKHLQERDIEQPCSVTLTTYQCDKKEINKPDVEENCRGRQTHEKRRKLLGELLSLQRQRYMTMSISLMN